MCAVDKVNTVSQDVSPKRVGIGPLSAVEGSGETREGQVLRRRSFFFIELAENAICI